MKLCFLSVLVVFAVVRAKADNEKLVNTLYYAIDKNDDGLLTLEEVGKTLLALDKNADGSVDEKEFVAGWLTGVGGKAQTAMAFFKALDLNLDDVLDMKDVKALHKEMDMDGNGELVDREFIRSMRKMLVEIPFIVMFTIGDHNGDHFISTPELDVIFSGFDVNRDGILSAGEFIGGWTRKGYSDVATAKRLYRLFDLDKDDKLSKDTDILSLFKRMDANRDGKVSQPEFVNQWLKYMAAVSKGPRTFFYDRKLFPEPESA